jgi:phage N-6-adenine-methyltransferase
MHDERLPARGGGKMSTEVAVIHDGEIVDPDAIEIGELYAKGRKAFVDSTKYLLECGQRLCTKKAGLPHGAWLPWLEANFHLLQFDSERTARMLMKGAREYYGKLASHLDTSDCLLISRAIWGHDDDEDDDRTVHVTQNSGNNEWYTPAEYLDMAREVMGGIDLDPASSRMAQQRVKATRYFTINDDGLSKKWKGRVWMNPPYGQPEITQFAQKMVEEVVARRVTQAITLTNNATETGWLHGMMKVASAACFHEGRIRFHVEDGELAGAPLQGQVFLYFGDEVRRFIEVFSRIGMVMVPG